jgi:LysR family glycine cleavage system transcriptional activator
VVWTSRIAPATGKSLTGYWDAYCRRPRYKRQAVDLVHRLPDGSFIRRRPRPLSLTQAGARLFPGVRDGLDASATALVAIRRHGDKQPLRVTTTNAFASRWLVPRLPRWRKLHPDAPLDVIGTDSVTDLRAGDADVAIRYARILPKDGIAKEFL